MTRLVQKLEQVAFTTAIDAVIKASEIIMPYWPNPLNTFFKRELALKLIEKEGLGNYATIADINSEKIIIETIQSQPLFKNHSFIAEESGEILNDTNWRWIIDPIDGTPNFRNGTPDFGIAIALFYGQESVLGLIAMPALKQIAVAVKGEEAKLLSYDGKQLAILRELTKTYGDSLNKALVGYDLCYEDRSRQLKEIVSKVSEKVNYACCLGSFSTGNFRLIQGMMGLYFGMKPTVMDIAPAAMLIPAVGGIITDLNGKPIDWLAKERTYIGAINPKIHREFLTLLHSL